MALSANTKRRSSGLGVREPESFVRPRKAGESAISLSVRVFFWMMPNVHW